MENPPNVKVNQGDLGLFFPEKKKSKVVSNIILANVLMPQLWADDSPPNPLGDDNFLCQDHGEG